MKTGTPISDKHCAITCRVTVLPVPVAPVMQTVPIHQIRQQADIKSRFAKCIFGDQEGI